MRSDLAWFGQPAECQMERTGAFVAFAPFELTGDDRTVTDGLDRIHILVDERVLAYARAVVLLQLLGHQGVALPGHQVRPKVVFVAVKGRLVSEHLASPSFVFPEDGVFGPARLHPSFVAKQQGFCSSAALSFSGLGLVL